LGNEPVNGIDVIDVGENRLIDVEATYTAFPRASPTRTKPQGACIVSLYRHKQDGFPGKIDCPVRFQACWTRRTRLI